MKNGEAKGMQPHEQLSMDNFEKNGFVVVSQVLSAHELDKVTKKLTSVLGAARNHSSHAVRHLARIAPCVRELATSKEVRSLCDLVLGTESFLVRSLFFDKTPETNW